MKNNLLCTPNLRILWLSKTYEGSVHDKKIMDEKPLKLKAGFLSHYPQDVIIHMPVKKPKGRQLTDQQKEKNRKISSFRVLVEHAIGGVKKYRIIKDRFRCRKFAFDDQVMLIACGLHNLRISLRMKYI